MNEKIIVTHSYKRWRFIRRRDASLSASLASAHSPGVHSPATCSSTRCSRGRRMESCSTVQVTMWGLAPSPGLCCSPWSPLGPCVSWKCFTAEWITKLFDCRDRAERGLSTIQGKKLEHPVTCSHLWCLMLTKKTKNQPSRSAARAVLS